jgi:hypothetical protein
VKCPEFAAVDGPHSKCNYCCEASLACFHGKNMALAQARDAATATAAAERAARGEPADPVVARREDFLRASAQAKTEREAILEHLKQIDDEDTAITLLLWSIEAQDYRIESAVREKISVADIEAKRRKKGTAKLLVAYLVSTLSVHNPAMRSALRAYFDIQIPSDEALSAHGATS